MYLYHYYEKGTQPFLNLSELSAENAEELLKRIRLTRPHTRCASRHADYYRDRLRFEEILRCEFAKKGGKTARLAPHYMTVGHSPWLSTWFDDCAVIKIPIEEFDKATLSFTYGDSHPTFSERINDGREYRKRLYTYDEILEVIEKYGMPQDWNDDGRFGPERYIEAHIWSDETIAGYISGVLSSESNP